MKTILKRKIKLINHHIIMIDEELEDLRSWAVLDELSQHNMELFSYISWLQKERLLYNEIRNTLDKRVLEI